MARVRSFLIGRHERCDLRIDGARDAERHAEVCLLPQGGYDLGDRASGGGTFVLRNARWQPLRQAFVQAGEKLRFGAFELLAEELEVLRELSPQVVAAPREQAPELRKPPGPDPEKGLMRDPLTGEILEKP